MNLKPSDLSQFCGSGMLYRHSLVRNFYYTEGVMHVAQHGEAYWLIDAIASWQHSDLAKHDPMLAKIQFWKLIVNEDSSAQLICERDTGSAAFTQKIVFTDFPLHSIRFYFTGGVLMLPAEY